MALNVFGKPITNQTLKAMMEYQDKEVITAVDRAYEALMMKDADNKVEKARKFVEGLKPKYGAALISTLYLIYKATGNRLTFESRYNGFIAATIYHGQDENGDAFDWILSWYNPRNDNNHAGQGNSKKKSLCFVGRLCDEKTIFRPIRL
ncbi:hypothetical protein FEM48_Zijuj11G0153400 [Ziziphus jujuba var. spinosa]|uniref:Uncharacterized protein n=1 Tax=Ziziphus jujuba var. spinosa TaxID=714518 RepID=A0A978UJQ4_ZIZJJ|nr:hypothetical protein FEM48_Zijuj11G0153400 [Ziziphus jujuba var. spinosa]